MEVGSQRILFFIFLNSEFSFNNPSIIIKFVQEHPKTPPEGCVSQNFDLGSK